GCVLGLGAVFEARDDALDVRLRLVLAELELGLDAADDQLDADDGAQLPLDELRRGLVYGPGLGTAVLVAVGQAAYLRLDPGRIVVDDELSVHVRGDVVPGRHHPVVLGLGRVPRRRHVRLGPPDDHQGLALYRLAPLSVVAGQMPDEDALVAGG